MYFAQKKMGWQIDWGKVRLHVSDRFDTSEIRYYSGLKDGDKAMQNYLKKLRGYGFITITKPLKKIYVGKEKGVGGYVYKANFDVEIATDLMATKKQFDNAIIFSGDSDFEYVIKQLQQDRKKVIVCAPERGLSHELRKAADEVWLLGNIRGDIGQIKRTSVRKPRII